VLDVLLLFAIPWRLYGYRLPDVRGGVKGTKLSEHTLEGPDDKRRSGRYDRDLGLSVLDSELYSDAEALPLGGRFGNVFSDLLRGLETKDRD
jgi:hypothetical protein